MSDNQNSTAEPQDNTLPAVSNAISTQPTGLVETTFAETLGLSMHNAVTSQQSSQMTTAASITNACARLLQASKIPAAKAKEEKKEAKKPEDITEGISAPQNDAPPAKRKFSIMNFIKKKDKDAADEQPDETKATATAQKADDEAQTTPDEPSKS